MGSQYGGNDSFPADFTVPSTGDAKNAGAFNVALEALGDRTKSLGTTRTALASLAALRAIDTTSLPNGTVRHVRGQGFFTLDTASVEAEAEPWVIDPTTGPGRWIGNVPHVTTRVVIVEARVIKGVTTTTFTAGGRDVAVDFIPHTSTHVNYGEAVQILEVNTGSAQSKGYLFPITDHVIDGARLSQVRAHLVPNPTHVGLPALMPSFAVRRVPRTSASAPAAMRATNNGFVDDPTTPVAAYNAIHDWTYTTTQNQDIDRSLYTYDILAFYEGSTNALANGGFQSWELTFTGRIPARGKAT